MPGSPFAARPAREDLSHMIVAKRSIVVLCALVLLCGCGIPRDPEGTLERASGGTLLAGMIPHEPWASAAGSTPEGIEVELIEAFAAEIGAEVQWFEGAESELFEALHEGRLDLVVGGIVSDSPFQKDAALTHPYLVMRTVVGFPHESGDDPNIQGREVAVQEGTADGGLVERAGAIPVPVSDITSAEGPRAVESWMLDDLGLVDLGVELTEAQHVMAVRMGENALMVRLERFLLDSGHLVRRLLKEAVP